MPTPIDGADFLGNVLETVDLGNGVTFEGRDFGYSLKTPTYPNLGWNSLHALATDDPDVYKIGASFFRRIP